MNRKLKAYKILKKLAHMDVEQQQKILKELQNRQESIEDEIKNTQETLQKEKEFMSENAPWGNTFLAFEESTKRQLHLLNLKIEEIQKEIDEEKEILLDFFATEKKFEHVCTQREKAQKVQEEKNEFGLVEDLIMMRRKF
jgi:hypothetical protein